jgi:hypothetical protein
MNEDKLNNDLKNRIREVFDDYTDTGADDGWLQLRQKFPVKEKDSGLGWLWYAAAAIVLLFSAIWLIPKTNRTKPVIAHIQNRGSDKQENNSIPPSVDTTQQPTDHMAKTTGTDVAGVTKSSTQLRQIPVNKRADLTTISTTNNITPNTVPPAIKQTDVILSGADSSIKMAVNNPADKLPDDTVKRIVNTPAQSMPVLPLAEHKKDIYELLAEKTNQDKQTKKAGNKPVISVYAATYFNYAKGSDSHINVGGGFTSDFHLTNKLKLSTGLAIAQNTFNYNNGTEPNSQQHEAAYATLAKEVAKANGSPIIGDGSKKSLAVLATNMGGTKSYNASLIGLDIPVNLKYEFDPQKSDAYVSAGLSSGTFINETYRAAYSYSQVSKESDTHNHFSGFDIAKTLNFAFGVGYPLGKSNRLIVEPFFKYPLDGLGEQHIRFGAGGVNLKLNFQSLKK